MQADWTNPDPTIADFLGRHGRYGIPFNIVYGPGAPAGIVLPELLTTEAVIDGAWTRPQPNSADFRRQFPHGHWSLMPLESGCGASLSSAAQHPPGEAERTRK